MHVPLVKWSDVIYIGHPYLGANVAAQLRMLVSHTLINSNRTKYIKSIAVGIVSKIWQLFYDKISYFYIACKEKIIHWSHVTRKAI